MSLTWLWAHPRSRSTALERMMMERGDVTVLHEPLVSLLDDGRVSIPDGPVLDSVTGVVEYARSLPGNVFVKDTTEHRYTDHLTPELAAGILIPPTWTTTRTSKLNDYWPVFTLSQSTEVMITR